MNDSRMILPLSLTLVAGTIWLNQTYLSIWNHNAISNSLALITGTVAVYLFIWADDG